jgi:hypothetical protein
MNNSKKKISSFVILFATVILAGVAIFTAVRLYQLRQQAVAPNVPTSKPKAADNASSCLLTFTISVSSTSPSPTATSSSQPTPTATAVATVTPTPTSTGGTPNNCGGTCGSNANCNSALICYSGFCRNPSCTSDTDCVCGTTAPTPTKTAAPTEEPSLPDAGVSTPTLFGFGAGIILLIVSLALAL